MPTYPDQPFENTSEVGLRVGALPADVVRALLEQVRIVVEEAGWDAPFSVYGVSRLTSPGSTTPGTFAVAIEFLHEGSHPFEDLPGLHLPARFHGSILACEGWEHPVPSNPEHPQVAGTTDFSAEEASGRETRMLTYLDRAGNTACMLLRYQDRRTPPEEVFIETGPSGRVHDVFRRFVGLPVDAEGTEVVHVLGRIWLASAVLLADTSPELPADLVLRSTDPLEVFVSPLREEIVAALSDASPPISGHLRNEMEDPVRREAVLRSFGLYMLGGFCWEDLRSASAELLGSFIDPEVAAWCDAGMFATFLTDHFPTQHESLERMVLRGFPAMAESVLEELAARSWNE